MSYQNTPPSNDADDEIAVLLGTTLLPSTSTSTSTTTTTTMTTTRDHRSSKLRSVAMIAGVVLLVIGGASSTPDVTPRRVPNKQSKKTSKPPETTDGGLTTMTTATVDLVVTTAGDGFRCEPATNTFGGWSSDFDPARGEYSTGPFQTCYKLPIRDQRDWTTSFQFCWSNSYWIDWGVMVKHYECDPVSDEWSPISKGKFYVGRDSCGKPCQTMDHMAK